MLRCKNSIRLSPVDLALFEALTGPGQPPPTTVSDYNQRLRRAALAWRQCPTYGERAMEAIASELLLDEDDASSVIDRAMLNARWH